MNGVPMKTSEILRGALDVLWERGWHQGDYVDPDSDALCSIGAIRVAALGSVFGPVGQDLTDQFGSVETACQRVSLLLGDRRPLDVWNDDPDRTFPEVVEAFERAIKLAEIKEAE